MSRGTEIVMMPPNWPFSFQRRWLIALLFLLAVNAARAETAANSPQIPITNANWAGTDDLGRSLPSFAQTGPTKPDRYVGLFYWQWHSKLISTPQYDMTEYLKTHPKEMDYNAFPPGGPAHPTVYWGQPLMGYYRSTDPWVIRKHLALIADAGVDFLFLDYTNAEVYDAELTTLLKVADDLKSKGLAVPRLTFFLNYKPEWKIESLYKNWYKPGKHDDMWFRWDGKPLLMTAMPTDASKLKDPALLPEIQKFFTWRKTWALGLADKDPHIWRFIATPQEKPAIGPDGKIEQMVVCKSMGGPIWNALEEGGVSAIRGKKFTAADYDNGWCLPDKARGVFFQTEWNKADKVGPPMLLVTGWNEWTAGIWEQLGVPMLGRPTAKGHGYIVDEFNMQFDRDLEPMKGGYGDDYYWQFVINMRKYKGMTPPEPVSARETIAIDGPVSEWDDVRPVYHDTVGDIADRDWDGSPPGIHYTDHSARNDIASAQVARDSTIVFFHVTTAAALTSPGDDTWMNLFIDTDQDRKTGWDGYDLLINRSRTGNTASVERHTGDGWNWKKVADVPIHWTGKDLVIAIPRKLLAPANPAGALRFDFKWADHLPAVPEPMDFYTKGDAAPDGRFNFRFEE
jgi:hypothetical protein